MVNEPIHVAVLVFDGVQILDFAGPYDVFGQAGFHVFTVGVTEKMVSTEHGLKVQPNFSLAEVADADIVVVPGGLIEDAVINGPLLRWLAGRSQKAKMVLSVCNGAFITAAAGLLDNLSATTHYANIAALRKASPTTTVLRNQRVVDNGTVVTAAGIAAGIDGALHVVAKILGEARAKQVALHMEYNWQPHGNYARAALADVHFHTAFKADLRFRVESGEQLRLLRSEGTRVNWVVEWHLVSGADAKTVLARLNDRLVAAGWTKLRSYGHGESVTSEWDFSDEYARPWRGVAGVVVAEKGLCHITVAVHREDVTL